MKPLIAANWKMYKLPSEAEIWTSELCSALAEISYNSVDIAICVPYTHLAAVTPKLLASQVRLGAQDVSSHRQGAYTGEISADMLKDLGVHYVIIGHSERRQYHQEDNELVHQKVLAARAQNLVPILCIGESLAEREASQAKEITLSQLKSALKDIALANSAELVIAYEPIWAIGTGKTATPVDAQEMCGAIRSELKKIYPNFASEIPILYGGSMKPDNAAELLAQPDIQGGLVGSASLDVTSLLTLIKIGQQS